MKRTALLATSCLATIVASSIGGAFYIAKKGVWFGESCRLGGRIGVQVMEEWQAYELDSENDWRILEKIASDLNIRPESSS